MAEHNKGEANQAETKFGIGNIDVFYEDLMGKYPEMLPLRTDHGLNWVDDIKYGIHEGMQELARVANGKGGEDWQKMNEVINLAKIAHEEANNLLSQLPRIKGKVDPNAAEVIAEADANCLFNQDLKKHAKYAVIHQIVLHTLRHDLSTKGSNREILREKISKIRGIGSFFDRNK